MMKIGFIGLGAMGRPMAFNLLAAGFEVFAFDLSEAAVKETEAKGARGCATAGELASKAEAIICSLPNAKIVESVMTGKGGVFENCHEGTIIIDMSSVSPNSTRAMAKKGSTVRCPLSGRAGQRRCFRSSCRNADHYGRC